MRILGLIPARAGSRGVPGKNLRMVAGKALLGWTVDSAVMSHVLDRIVLSTDGEDIADAARSMGIEVPFMRPDALAADDTPMVEVVVHTLEVLASDGYVPDAVVILQPTSPLRRARHIDAAASMLGTADSVCSVTPLPKELSPHYVMKIRDDGYLDHFLRDGPNYTRRQDVPAAYRRDGTVYLTRRDVVMRQRDLYGERCVPMIIDDEDSLSIDHERDIEEAERRLRARQVTCSRYAGGTSGNPEPLPPR